MVAFAYNHPKLKTFGLLQQYLSSWSDWERTILNFILKVCEKTHTHWEIFHFERLIYFFIPAKYYICVYIFLLHKYALCHHEYMMCVEKESSCHTIPSFFICKFCMGSACADSYHPCARCADTRLGCVYACDKSSACSTTLRAGLLPPPSWSHYYYYFEHTKSWWQSMIIYQVAKKIWK